MAEPFLFTKGCPVMKIKPDRVLFMGDYKGDILFDLQEDPGQQHPIEDQEVYARLVSAIKAQFDWLDAPEELYYRYGIPR